MFYPYTITEENGKFFCVVRDLDFYSEGDTAEQAEQLMSDGLYRYIEDIYRKNGKPIPEPSEPVKGQDSLFYVDLKSEARIRLWNLLREKHMSTTELSRLLGVSRQYAHNMVTGANSVSMDKYAEAFEALGYYLSLELNPYK
ncbi:helix-turn-helix domain-containing protein [Turicimonas muris]|uniref:helix-turn-helix domain-containing protein n=1 Tax=Turicimonas muris TaxID=1796652 RepID=UPI0024948A8E|nr:type II toxin-antitoxin system HicB family antitoxin [Turicimonas muris]